MPDFFDGEIVLLILVGKHFADSARADDQQISSAYLQKKAEIQPRAANLHLRRRILQSINHIYRLELPTPRDRFLQSDLISQLSPDSGRSLGKKVKTMKTLIKNGLIAGGG